jgi:hypothetical protein
MQSKKKSMDWRLGKDKTRKEERNFLEDKINTRWDHDWKEVDRLLTIIKKG